MNNPSPVRPIQSNQRFEEVHSIQGGRKVELFVPIEYNGRKHSAVEISPCKLDHVMRWNEGRIKGSLALLSELTGLEQGALRQLCYPDADRVMAVYVNSLPPVIRTDIENGVTPIPKDEPQTPEGMPAHDIIEETGTGFSGLTGDK